MDSKYQDILDSEILAFIKQTEDFYPADAVNATIHHVTEQSLESFNIQPFSIPTWVASRKWGYQWRDHPRYGFG